jgi:hypothetical protein
LAVTDAVIILKALVEKNATEALASKHFSISLNSLQNEQALFNFEPTGSVDFRKFDASPTTLEIQHKMSRLEATQVTQVTGRQKIAERRWTIESWMAAGALSLSQTKSLKAIL